MTTAERIRQVDANGWALATAITTRIADEGISGNVTPGVRAFVAKLAAEVCPDWDFSLITLADGKITAAPATYKGTIE